MFARVGTAVHTSTFSCPKSETSVNAYFGAVQCSNVTSADMYVKSGEPPNAVSYALPGAKPIIVINSSLIELMQEDELQAAILHELGHLLSKIRCMHRA